MKLNVFASRHSAFYSPLIASIAAGFLEREGIEAAYRVLQPGERSQDLIREGRADIIQSAVSSNWKPMEAGNSPLPVHFATINQRDGFFLAARAEYGASFNWAELEGRTLLADHGGQPLAMLKYAVHRNGARWDKIRVVDHGAPGKMMDAFRAGEGDFVHLQGPGAEVLAEEGHSSYAISVGAAVPEVAFSSLCCSRAFADTEACRTFLRGYTRAREWVQAADAEEVAAKQGAQFPEVSQRALAGSIANYQKLGTWGGPVAIGRDLYERALDVFQFSKLIEARHSYDEVCVVDQE